MSTRTRATGSVSAACHCAAVRRRVAAALALASSTAARSPGSISASGASWDVMRAIVSAASDAPDLAGVSVEWPPRRRSPVSAGSDAGGGLQLVGAVRVLPGELGELATEVAVGRGLGVDRAEQVEVADDRGGAEVEYLEDGGLDLLVRDDAGAEGLDEHADGRGLADGVRDLRLAAAGQSGGHDVLGDPAHRVGGRAVDLRRVLAGERAAAVAGHAAVGVDDDLAAGEPGVAHRA